MIYRGSPDLLPTLISQRTIGTFTYTIIILSMAITTSIFFFLAFYTRIADLFALVLL
jgi:hypothetical protein